MLDSLRAKQAEGQISKKVEFIGHVIDKSAIQSLYRKSDAFIFTTRSEGFGRVLLEAMSQSLPIFTTMVGGIPGFMKNEYNCLEIPVYDSAGQAEIIRKSIGDKALMAKIAANGLKTLADVQSKYPSHVDLLLIKYNESQAISKHS
jgi:glycosyltransferase involved in cell wall biosynthesis